MKTYNIELQRVKAIANGHGLIHARIDALVQPQPARRGADDDGAEPHTLLSMSEDTARVLLLLLKAQLAEFDKRKPKSRF
jgi:hypothetical protein